MTEISDTEAGVVRTPRFIRTTHPQGYRSGKWATLAGRTDVRGRDCYVVRFDDGQSDFWVVEDKTAGYEFSEAGPDVLW